MPSMYIRIPDNNRDGSRVGQQDRSLCIFTLFRSTPRYGLGASRFPRVVVCV